MIPRDVIEHIFSAAKIEEVVSDYVTLRKRGANLIGLCPFHNEKTGSFTVSPSKGIYKCFGCGVSGNAVGFVMAMEQCSFADAIKQLGKKYHIEVPERQMTAEEQQRQDDRESMFVVNDFANKWFQEQLWETKEGQAIGLSYFRERGLRDDIIRKYQLGYSPEKGSPLAAALKKKGFSERFILNDVDTKIGVGVVGKSEDGRIYDRFRDRVMFPIFTVSGKPVAFAGRILKKKDNVGKYVNSPDSIIYSKTNELYGLFQAKQAISRADMCYLVEGQMDVISMFQSGIENVVASGGTALTKPQIRLIQRFTSNITVLYDGDAAGIHAALRGIDMFLEEGFNVKVVLLPNGEDPDSFAQSHDSTEFIQYIADHQTDFIRFKLQLLSKEAGQDSQKRIELVNEIARSISVIPDIIARRNYIRDCSMQLNVDEQSLVRGTDTLRKKRFAEEKKLWEEYSRTGLGRDEIIVKYLPLIKYVVSRMAVTPPSGLDYEDLLSFGVFGLLDAVEKFDPSKGFVFQTYAIPRIRGAILDELRKCDWFSRTGREKVQKLNKAMEKILRDKGEIRDELLMAEMGIDEDEYYEIQNLASRGYITSLDDTTPLDDGEVSVEATLADEREGIVEHLDDESEKQELIEALSELPERERNMLSLYYYEGLNLKEIGKVLGVTETRVSQIHGKALSMLRAILKEKMNR